MNKVGQTERLTQNGKLTGKIRLNYGDRHEETA